MPYTLSHPAAVLPLRRLCPRYLDFSALVIGSLTPDAGYYVRRFDLASFAHTFLGSFAVCLPVGIFLLVSFYLIRRPVCFILPTPHREALFSLCSSPLKISLRRVLIVVFCLLLGAWTHIFWDSFTHQTGWFVVRIPWLRDPVFAIGATQFHGYYLLQQLSTVVGGILVLVAYFAWMRRHRPARADNTESERLALFRLGRDHRQFASRCCASCPSRSGILRWLPCVSRLRFSHECVFAWDRCSVDHFCFDHRLFASRPTELIARQRVLSDKDSYVDKHRPTSSRASRRP